MASLYLPAGLARSLPGHQARADAAAHRQQQRERARRRAQAIYHELQSMSRRHRQYVLSRLSPEAAPLQSKKRPHPSSSSGTGTMALTIKIMEGESFIVEVSARALVKDLMQAIAVVRLVWFGPRRGHTSVAFRLSLRRAGFLYVAVGARRAQLNAAAAAQAHTDIVPSLLFCRHAGLPGVSTCSSPVKRSQSHSRTTSRPFVGLGLTKKQRFLCCGKKVSHSEMPHYKIALPQTHVCCDNNAYLCFLTGWLCCAY
jgi:hypothetical protein